MPLLGDRAPSRPSRSRDLQAVSAGAAVGVLGGLVGLGGAEFRLPLLIALFGFGALHAVVLNKALSLAVVVAALPARLVAVPPGRLAPHLDVVLDLLVGSLVGAWLGASWAVRARPGTLHRVLAALLLLLAAVLLATHTGTVEPLDLPAGARLLAGAGAGVLIGVVAAVMGVAGGELLIPTIVLLHGLDIKTAGSLSLLVSLPTMLVAFARYSRDGSFAVLRASRRFLALTAAGSVAGSVAGGLLVGVVPARLLVPVLAGLLVLSAGKVWQHRWSGDGPRLSVRLPAAERLRSGPAGRASPAGRSTPGTRSSPRPRPSAPP